MAHTTLIGHAARRLCVVLLAQAVAALQLPQSLRAADDPTGKDLAFALQDAFADAIERAEPSLVSVVRMRNSDGVLADSLLSPQDDNRPLDMRRVDPRRGVLRDRVHASWGDTYDPNWMPQDFGSGVILDEGGLVLTNHHVV